jgi:glycosyltransferase involved in cell wall biosynthesis
MKILFISAIYPYPLYSGGQVRIYNLLKQVGARHEVTFLSFIREEKERQLKKHLPFVKENIQIMRGKGFQLKYAVHSLLHNQPMLISTYDNALMKDAINTSLKKEPFDLIHIEPFYVVPSLPDVSLPLVVSEHNIEYHVYEKNAVRANPFIRSLMLSDAKKIQTWEQETWKRGDQLIAVSEEDASIIRDYSKSVPVTVVPNGVDTDEFTFVPHKTDASHPNFIFVGNFLWIPNRDAVSELLTEIWPVIKRRLPDATLSIIGKNIPSGLRKEWEGVVWKEHVHDIREVYQSADGLVAPLSIGGGSKYKIIEAMASGCPVVTTKEGAQGLSVTQDEMAIVETPDEFAQACTSIVLEPILWKSKTLKSRKKIENMYSWKHIAETLERVWEKAV